MTTRKPSTRAHATTLEADHLLRGRRLDAQFERPMAIRSWARPSAVDVSDVNLRWIAATGEDHLADEPEEQWQDLEPGLLRGFLRLADAGPEDVLRFAERWGVLELCHHGLPSSHTMNTGAGPLALEVLVPAGADVPSEISTGDCRKRTRAGWVIEPLATWRRISSTFGAIVHITTAERLGRSPDASDWEVLGGDKILVPTLTPERSAPVDPRTRSGRFRRLDRRSLGPASEVRSSIASGYVNHFIQGWFEVAGTRLQYRWGPGGAELFVGTGGLFGALVVDLALAVGGSHGFAFCSSCSLPYVPERQPSAGRRNYCGPCRREGVPLRDAKRDQRRRARVAEPGEST